MITGDGRQPPGGVTPQAVSLASYHARRLRLTVEWRPRNTHLLQAAAHDLCDRA